MVVDSPLTAKFNEAYRQLKPYWDAEAHKHLHSGRHPLSFEELITVDDHESHMAFVEKVSMDSRASLAKVGEETAGVGAVVLAASGMCAGGPW